MNWVKGGRLSDEEIENLGEADVVYIEYETLGGIVWRIGDVGFFDMARINISNWDVYNVSVEIVAPDAEYRAGREAMGKVGWTDELFEEYFPNQYDHRILPDIEPGTTPEDEQANRDWGSFS